MISAGTCSNKIHSSCMSPVPQYLAINTANTETRQYYHITRHYDIIANVQGLHHGPHAGHPHIYLYITLGVLGDPGRVLHKIPGRDPDSTRGK
ncbi:hypothetical protein GDO81_007111 [Engystomops pustulosus]|uniref:Uncharacterized protein n=1 Tax=Engystomops pustulosus TaxID=76066 RepID=A0AAV7C539_ENGPU|nr:hypothetical protein GDO81_007111 [Engystomops pustulosus]